MKKFVVLACIGACLGTIVYLKEDKINKKAELKSCKEMNEFWKGIATNKKE